MMAGDRVRPGRTASLVLGCLLLLVATPAPASSSAVGAVPTPTSTQESAGAWFVRGATLWSHDVGFVEDGAVIVRAGKVVAVGADLQPGPDDTVLDLPGAFLLPGLVEAHSQLGLHGDPIAWDTDEDIRPLTPELHAIDGYYPFAAEVEAALRAGITTVRVAPGGKNLIGGSAVVLKTAGTDRDDHVVRNPAAMKLSLGEEPKRDGAAPRTRMGEMALLREHFARARDYERRRSMAAASGEDFAEDPEFATTAAALRGEIPALVQAYRAQDIRNALRIGDEFQLDIELAYATEAHLLAGTLAAQGVPVILTSLKGLWYRLEKESFSPRNAGRLLDAGVAVALQHGEGSPYGSADLLFNARVLVGEGVSEEAALRTITSTPAEILELPQRIGHLRAGADGDLVVLSGPPFELTSRVLMVFVDGRLQIDETG